MALKDWKLQKTRRGMIKYKDSDGRWIYASKVETLRGGKMWAVDSNDPNFYEYPQFFKTREKAVRFMRRYMHNH